MKNLRYELVHSKEPIYIRGSDSNGYSVVHESWYETFTYGPYETLERANLVLDTLLSFAEYAYDAT